MRGLDVGAQPELIGQVVTTFLGDAESLFRAAHGLKASSTLVGAMRLSSVAKQLEAAGSKGSLDDAPVYSSHLRAEYERVRPELEAVV